MIREALPVDLSTMPDLARLAEEVRATGTPRILRQGTDDVALLIPAPRRKRRRREWKPSEAQLAVFRAAAGGWKDVDTDQLLKDVYASRGSSRPPVEL